MIKFRLFVCVLLQIFLLNTSFSQDRIALIKKDGKYGYINDKGQYIAEPIYTEAFSFSEGLAPVKVGEKWGYLDKTGKMLISPQYDYANWFWEGLAAVKKGEKYGYINKKMKSSFHFNMIIHLPFRKV